MHLLLILIHIWFVSFLDKPEKSAPALSERAKEQRAKWNIPTDGMDYPVCTLYQNELRKMGVKIHHTSRWFNGVTCEMDSATAVKVEGLKFVTGVELTRDRLTPEGAPKRRFLPAAPSGSQPGDSTYTQLATYNLLPLHQAGFEGQGILMAVCDGGFSGADTLSCFRQKELALGHFDFTDDLDKHDLGFYTSGASGRHGTMCLSTISGIRDNYYGAATKAKYYLMRTEESVTESPKEIDNLVAALEKADSLGVNIFSVSLGYYYFNNHDWDIQKQNLDGKTFRASRAAAIAARKGMLVCVAAGNEGNKEWQTIGVPADADSVLAVGAVGTDSVIGAFSSIGPAADGRIKPDVCAVGVSAAIINTEGKIERSNGTSFATPLLAGLAACLWSALPDENAMQIRNRIIRSADRYYHPDNTYGYGIPDAWKAYTLKEEELSGSVVRKTDVQIQKIIRDGKVLIIRGDKVYNLSGQIQKW